MNEQGAAWNIATFSAPSPKDTLYHRAAYPDGFIYKCCSRDGTEPGWRHGPYKARDERKSQGVIELSQMKILDVGDKDEDNEENDNQETGDEENQDEDY